MAIFMRIVKAVRAGDDPVLYSVGENGLDDGGSSEPIVPDDPRFADTEKDIVLHLRGKMRTAPPDYYADEGLKYQLPYYLPPN